MYSGLFAELIAAEDNDGGEMGELLPVEQESTKPQLAKSDVALADEEETGNPPGPQ